SARAGRCSLPALSDGCSAVTCGRSIGATSAAAGWCRGGNSIRRHTMPLPEPNEWEVRNTRLGRACRDLYAHAGAWRDTVYASEVERGEIKDEATRRELAALDEFIAACEAEGLDR